MKSVLVLYGIAALFSFTAILYTMVSKFYGLVLLVISMVLIELIFNTTGLFRLKKTKEKQVPVKEQKEDVSVGEASEK